MSNPIIIPFLKKINANGQEIHDDTKRTITEMIKDDNVVLFKEVVEKELLTFPPEIYCDIVQHKAMRIFHYLFIETRTKQEQKKLDECYKNIQEPTDAGFCGKRSANQKQMTKTLNVDDYCNVPQAIFHIAAQHDDKRILQFIIACGVPVDIDTYNQSRKSAHGWCSSLSGSLNRKCRPNERKIDGILRAL